MFQYDAHNLVIQPGGGADPETIVEVTPELAHWEYLSFQVRRLSQGDSWSATTITTEMAIVVLSGCLDIRSSRGEWTHVGERANVFAGLPSALYLPRETVCTVTAVVDTEFAVAEAPASKDFPPCLVTPDMVTTEIRGGDQATRQINSILPPGFGCEHLVIVEVYTPAGNWSSYPPHKHDVHKVDAHGYIVEADLEEIYFYKIDHPEGFAFQRIYTSPESPLQQAGFPIDAVVLAKNNAAVLVPEGYHPVASPPGYTTYYLNVLAGSAQSLANTEDPAHAWVKEQYQARDSRVPLYYTAKLDSVLVLGESGDRRDGAG